MALPGALYAIVRIYRLECTWACSLLEIQKIITIIKIITIVTIVMILMIIRTGWSDTEGASDQHTFKDLLRHLQKEQLTCIKVTAMIVIMMTIVGRAF